MRLRRFHQVDESGQTGNHVVRAGARFGMALKLKAGLSVRDAPQRAVEQADVGGHYQVGWLAGFFSPAKPWFWLVISAAVVRSLTGWLAP